MNFLVGVLVRADLVREFVGAVTRGLCCRPELAVVPAAATTAAATALLVEVIVAVVLDVLL